jgi:hypothetical protein
MHNKLKFVVVIIFSVLFLSFSKTNKTTTSSAFSIFIAAGDTLTWKMLENIKYVKKAHPKYGTVEFPVVNDQLKAKGKKKVFISGFIVPIDSKNYAISKNVFAACFFCGKAGPESIAGLKFKGETPKLKTDQYVTVQGTFRYNETDADDWIYNIDDVVIVKSK